MTNIVTYKENWLWRKFYQWHEKLTFRYLCEEKRKTKKSEVCRKVILHSSIQAPKPHSEWDRDRLQIRMEENPLRINKDNLKLQIARVVGKRTLYKLSILKIHFPFHGFLSKAVIFLKQCQNFLFTFKEQFRFTFF